MVKQKCCNKKRRETTFKTIKAQPSVAKHANGICQRAGSVQIEQNASYIVTSLQRQTWIKWLVQVYRVPLSKMNASWWPPSYISILDFWNFIIEKPLPQSHVKSADFSSAASFQTRTFHLLRSRRSPGKFWALEGHPYRCIGELRGSYGFKHLYRIKIL